MLLNALSSILTKQSKHLLGLRREHVLGNHPQKLHLKRFHLQQLAGPINSKQHNPIKLSGLSLDKAVKIKGINEMIILFE
jgi:hypothetical protein